MKLSSKFPNRPGNIAQFVTNDRFRFEFDNQGTRAAFKDKKKEKKRICKKSGDTDVGMRIGRWKSKRNGMNEAGNILSSLSESKEMERKLIGAVNVNTRIDVRDRKSGLANWLTVSSLYPLLPLFLLFPLLRFLSLSLASWFSVPLLSCSRPFLLFVSLFLRLSCFSFHVSSSPQSPLPVHHRLNGTFDLAFGCRTGFLIWVVAIGRNPLSYSLRDSKRINRISLSQNYAVVTVVRLPLRFVRDISWRLPQPREDSLLSHRAARQGALVSRILRAPVCSLTTDCSRVSRFYLRSGHEGFVVFLKSCFRSSRIWNDSSAYYLKKKKEKEKASGKPIEALCKIRGF